jgi:hypothetical protein
MKLQITAALILSAVAAVKAQEPTEKSSMADCPMTTKDSGAAMNARGDKAMGFSQDKTTHHFTLMEDGGSIEVLVNDPKDAATREQIRGHLSHIAQMFEHGNFQIPMLVHGKMPDGAAVMQERKTKITYAYEETNSGGRVRIRTSDPEALEGVHEFLRFQIGEHRTGDATEVKGKS